MAKHEVKILKEYFLAKYHGKKMFEVRFDDRNYQVGDTVLYTVIEDGKQIPNCPKILTKITYVLKDYDAVKKGWVVFGEKKVRIIRPRSNVPKMCWFCETNRATAIVVNEKREPRRIHLCQECLQELREGDVNGLCASDIIRRCKSD